MINMKDKRDDGFANTRLRSLTVAAMLRCLYASIEYAPTLELKKQAIQNIQNATVFKEITQLCDACDWDEDVNIGGKFLRVARHCIVIPFDEDYESETKLVFYELISIVLQRILDKIVYKMDKGFEIKSKDKITSYELTRTFYVIIN